MSPTISLTPAGAAIGSVEKVSTPPSGIASRAFSAQVHRDLLDPPARDGHGQQTVGELKPHIDRLADLALMVATLYGFIGLYVLPRLAELADRQSGLIRAPGPEVANRMR